MDYLFSITYSPYEEGPNYYDAYEFKVVAADFNSALKKAEKYFIETALPKLLVKAKVMKKKGNDDIPDYKSFKLSKIELEDLHVVL
jgi:hypothetical protein